MNFKEGMRRLALLVGVLGVTLGCFASYLVLRDALETRARHKAFERLATSDVVQQERETLQVEVQGPDGKYYLFPHGTTKEAAISYFKKKGIGEPGVAGPWEKYQSKTHQAADDPYAAITYTRESTVNKGGIKTIHWSKVLGIESIETEDGKTLYPTPAPTLWRYLLAVAFPVLGFAAPWASVRALAWVGVGFFEKSK